MRRAAILALRATIVLLLAAAVADLSLPGRSADRVRIHLIDRSASVLAGGPPESLRPGNADTIVAHDRATAAAGDVVTWASFGKDLAFESAVVDPSGSDLEAALGGALARNPTEIVLYTDGRGSPGRALFLCKERGVPVHVLPLGPRTVRDVRFRSLRAPADAAYGERISIELTVESSFDVTAKVSLDGDARSLVLARGVPQTIAFPDRAAGDFKAMIDVADDCPENNAATIRVYRRTAKRPILLLSQKPPPLPDFDVIAALRPSNLDAYDAVVVDNVPLAPKDQEALAAYVRSGGGLLLLGGELAFAEHWKGSVLEQLSPLKAYPDLRVAVVFGIDCSGSMSTQLDTIVEALTQVRPLFDADDPIFALSFADVATVLPDLSQLRKIRTSGGTRIARGIEESIRQLKPIDAGRKQIILMTDGETAAEEKPADRKAAAAQLGSIGLTIVTTNRKVDVGENIAITDWRALEETLKRLVNGIEETRRAGTGALAYREHPVTQGAGAIVPRWIHRGALRPDAQVVASAGQDAVVAFRQEGEGRVGVLAFPDAPPAFCSRAIEYVAGDGGASLRLSIDPPFVRARGIAAPSFTTLGIPVAMKQVRSDLWEGTLPPGISGTAVVRYGRARASATIPCPPELEALGVDADALARFARETGGRVLGSLEELAGLPRPARSEPKSGRASFLIAALVLVFVELGIVVFWKV